MNKDTLRELIKQVIDEMSEDEDILTAEITNTGDVAGFDGPLTTKKITRKMKDNKEDE